VIDSNRKGEGGGNGKKMGGREGEMENMQNVKEG
jgi:hypothetical protein